MYKLIAILCLSLTFCGQSHAQFTYKADQKHANISTSYQAVLDISSERQLFQHGVAVEASISLANKYREKQEKTTGYNRIVDRDIYLKANISTYSRTDIHQALLINAGPAFRVTLPKGLFFEFDGRVGYMRTFLKGDHFTFDGSDISSTSALGNNLLSIHAASSFGWDFYKSNQYPVYLFSSIGLMSYFPNNDNWVLQPVFTGGLGFVISRIKETYE